MKRRELIAMLGGALATWPLPARAQQPERVRRVGLLMGLNEDDPSTSAQLTVFREGMRALGWADGRNLGVDVRFGAAIAAKAGSGMAELLALNPEVLAVQGPGMAAAMAATQTVPIVFLGGAFPVEQNWVASLAHPGGNITGFTSSEPSFGPKWLELLKEVSPKARRVAVLTGIAPWLDTISAGAERFALEIMALPVQSPAEIDDALAGLADKPIDGLVLPDDARTSQHRQPIIEFATRHRLPLVAGNRVFALDGGLIYYGTNFVDLYRRSPVYVDRILKGAKPAELPVQQPTKFEFAINLKTAKTLGVALPATLLARTDEVIE